MKKYAILLLAIFFLAGCAAKEPAQYAQAVLPAPNRIEVDAGTSIIAYDPETEEYQKLYNALSANWWLTGENGTDLQEVTSLKKLKTSSEDTFRHTAGDIVFFVYEEPPLPWDVTEEEQISVALVGFVIPDIQQESETPVKGHFLVAQTLDWGVENEGLYTYFYPPEIANDLWGFLKD